MRLRKLYIDVAGADGSFAIVYLVALAVSRVVSRFVAVEAYTADGRRDVFRPRWPRWGDDALAFGPPLDTPLLLEDRHGEQVVLTFARSLGPWAPTTNATAALRWHVVHLMMDVTVKHSGGRTIAGAGYSDYVEMSRLPRRLGMSTVRWGRAHGDDGTAIVFNSVRRQGRPEWHVAAVAGRVRPLVGLSSLRESSRPSGATTLHLPTTGWSLCLGQGRTLHEGTPFDRDRVSSRAERLLARAASGPSHEIRWISPATITDPVGRQAGAVCVHERVSFR